MITALITYCLLCWGLAAYAWRILDGLIAAPHAPKINAIWVIVLAPLLAPYLLWRLWRG